MSMPIEDAFAYLRSSVEEQWLATAPDRPDEPVTVLVMLTDSVFELTHPRLGDALIAALNALPFVEQTERYCAPAITLTVNDGTVEVVVPDVVCVRVQCHPYASVKQARRTEIGPSFQVEELLKEVVR